MKKIFERIQASRSDDPLGTLSLRETLRSDFSAQKFCELIGRKGAPLEDALAHFFRMQRPVLLNGKLGPRPERLTIKITDYPDLHLDYPVDWSKQVSNQYYWRLKFQSLAWLPKLCSSDRNAAEHAVLEYRKHLLNASQTLDLNWDSFTFGDHAMAMRCGAISEFLKRYLKEPLCCDEEVIVAALQILLIQISCLLEEACYTQRHNHGLFQDLAVLDALESFRFPESEKIAKRVMSRIIDQQLLRSISEDGMHIENSPEYHLLFIKLITRISLRPSVNESERVRLQELAATQICHLMHSIVPNSSLVAIGDTSRKSVKNSFSVLIEQLEGSTSEIVRKALDQLEYFVSSGRRGTAPPTLSACFPSVGYTAFRSAWGADDTNPAKKSACLHIKSGYGSSIHKHEDAGSICLYGLGRELIVDPGKFSNDKFIPEAAGTRSLENHSTFVVRDIGERMGEDTVSGSETLAYHIGESPWIASRRYVNGHKVDRVVVFNGHDEVVVVDTFRASRSLEAFANFVLHPDLNAVLAKTNSCIRFKAGNDLLALSLSPIPIHHLLRDVSRPVTATLTSAPFHPEYGVRTNTQAVRFNLSTSLGLNTVAFHLSLSELGKHRRAGVSVSRRHIHVRFRKGTVQLPLPGYISLGDRWRRWAR